MKIYVWFLRSVDCNLYLVCELNPLKASFGLEISLSKSIVWFGFYPYKISCLVHGISQLKSRLYCNKVCGHNLRKAHIFSGNLKRKIFRKIVGQMV